MSNLDKLRQKRALRQAADPTLEALLESSDATVPPSSGSEARAGGGSSRAGSSVHGVSFGVNLERTDPAASAQEHHVGAVSSQRPQPSPIGGQVFSAHGSCPASAGDLRDCVLRFICGSPAFGPLPVSGVGLNAALRREYMRAGHDRTKLSIFRASDTVAALRSIYQDLCYAQSPTALLVEESADGDDLLVVDADIEKVRSVLMAPDAGRDDAARLGSKRRRSSGGDSRVDPAANATLLERRFPSTALVAHSNGGVPTMPMVGNSGPQSVDDLLKAPTAKQRQLMDAGDELRKLLAEPTTRQSLTAQKFMNKNQNMAQFCPNGSRADCKRVTGTGSACSNFHFKKIIKPWTDESLGDCSYLDTCRHIDKCKYVHYALDLTVEQAKYLNEAGVHNRGTDTKRLNELAMKGVDMPAQWVHCDMRKFPLGIFKGLISVVMADPPWDIHMELPYGTLTDDEVRNLRLGDIHEDGVLFLWVTGRAMELARDCFRIWGYKRIEEIIWVKTNQLQRIIRTGRTGHWINHSKEHCLVGIKGNPKLNKNLDCDVIVSEVRETSRKPDEIYNLIERMFPNCQKLELFGRPHNVHENWITCGNQLDGVRLCDEEMVRRWNLEFPLVKTEPWRKEHEAVVPVQVPPAGCQSSVPGEGLGKDGAPWIPPSAPGSGGGAGSAAPRGVGGTARPFAGDSWNVHATGPGRGPPMDPSPWGCPPPHGPPPSLWGAPPPGWPWHG